jgi:hypothetical protein
MTPSRKNIDKAREEAVAADDQPIEKNDLSDIQPSTSRIVQRVAEMIMIRAIRRGTK